MIGRSSLIVLFFIMLVYFTSLVVAQDSAPLPDKAECAPETLAMQFATMPQILVVDFDADPQTARDNLFRLGTVFQSLALQCGYVPSEPEVENMIQHVLSFAEIADIVAANSVGSDVDAALLELETIRGDLFSGELLYNGLENGLDGTPLGCSGCHSGETAPSSVGTWTRIDEIRLHDPALADYDVERYLVESILQPNAYIVPDYLQDLMPSNFGTRLDSQMLADLVAYLDSQDQLLGDSSK